MANNEDVAARKRQELKIRLLAQQEKVKQGGYQVNEFGEIIRQPVSGFSHTTRTTPVNHVADVETREERAGVFALIISFIFPVIGVFIYFLNKGDVVNPKAYLYAAGWGLFLNVLLSIIFE